jgi:signal transduction histidine kinase
VEVPFADIAREAVDLVRGQLSAGGVLVQIDDDLPTVHVDRMRMVEMMQNLLDNAAKFMGPAVKPTIVVGRRAARRDGAVVLFVKDNGIGIECAHHEKVFELFTKLDPRSNGTGMGCARAKRIVEVHGGRIWVESDGAGKGSTFCFTLPVAGTVESVNG